ncbi:MAG: hypothetical protein V4671_30210, partial [Armatimonadota bacterium]
MEGPRLIWQYKWPKAPLETGPRSACITADHIVTVAFCLNRQTGEPLWQKPPGHWQSSLDLIDVGQEVAVATRMRWDSPVVYYENIYRIDISTGDLMYPVRAPGPASAFLERMDRWQKRSTLGTSAAPLCIDGNEVIAQDGVRISLATGLPAAKRNTPHPPRSDRMFSPTGNIVSIGGRENCVEVVGFGTLYPSLPGLEGDGRLLTNTFPHAMHLKDLAGNVVWVNDDPAFRESMRFTHSSIYSIEKYLLFTVQSREPGDSPSLFSL